MQREVFYGRQACLWGVHRFILRLKNHKVKRCALNADETNKFFAGEFDFFLSTKSFFY